MRPGLIPGHNVDRLDIQSGLDELRACGYDDSNTTFVVEYALLRWAHGEEDRAQRSALDLHFHGINLTSWYRVLAAAKAGAQSKES